MSVQHKLEAIATRLKGVRWSRDRTALRARCPAHGSKGGTLSVRIHPADDRLQLVCFAGCGAVAVLSAIGFEISALYPDRARQDHRMRRLPPIPYREALACSASEALHVLLCGARLEQGHPITPADLARLTLAVDRLRAAARIAGVHL